jgi:Chalcone isomerase-like
MHLIRTKLSAVMAALVLLFSLFIAVEARADGDYVKTGSATRVKKVAFISVDVYDITHSMKSLPKPKSKQAIIEMDVSKKFEWTMKRDVDHEKIVDALKEAYAMNRYADTTKINQLMAAFRGELKKGSRVTIIYDADKKATTINVDGGGSATVPGVDFMKGTWKIWFGAIDQADLGDRLMSQIP